MFFRSFMCCVAEARASGVPVIRSVQCRNLALGSAVVCTSALYWVLKFYAAVDNEPNCIS